MFGQDGRIATKVYQWAGTYYYFDPNTYLRVDNNYRQSQWGDWYLFGNDGRFKLKFRSGQVLITTLILLHISE